MNKDRDIPLEDIGVEVNVSLQDGTQRRVIPFSEAVLKVGADGSAVYGEPSREIDLTRTTVRIVYTDDPYDPKDKDSSK